MQAEQGTSHLPHLQAYRGVTEGEGALSILSL